MHTKTLTYGARLVGLNFNPSELSTVTECKQLFATAITQMQDAQMWAVKAYTWRD